MTDVSIQRDLIIGLVLYGLLPLWVVAGFIDYLCHRASRIQESAGLKEAMLHNVMGVQVGVTVFIALIFEVNVLVMLLCVFVVVTHVFVAHHDVVYATPKRRISIWETHAHAFLSTIPFYILALIAVLRWDVVLDTLSLNWAGQMNLTLREQPVGSATYVRSYLVFMVVVGALPYAEETLRCWRYARRMKREAALPPAEEGARSAGGAS